MKTHRGLTLVELLVVIGIIVILAGLTFAFASRAKAATKSTECLANLHQLGLAMSVYQIDADDQKPGPATYPLGAKSFEVGIGWAGKVYPYAKSTNVFGCAEDDSVAIPTYVHANSSKISFAINDNLTARHGATPPESARTVLLFEVSRSFAYVKSVDEGMTPRPGGYQKMSAAGNGIKGDLLESYIPWARSDDDVSIQYVTGRLSNSDNDVLADDFAPEGRHRAGANYLLADGHAAFAAPGAVSAGSNAPNPGGAQTALGCFIPPATSGTGMPCAEGTAATGHKLTFSGN